MNTLVEKAKFSSVSPEAVQTVHPGHRGGWYVISLCLAVGMSNVQGLSTRGKSEGQYC